MITSSNSAWGAKVCIEILSTLKFSRCPPSEPIDVVDNSHR
jgi:hypothetical protein